MVEERRNGELLTSLTLTGFSIRSSCEGWSVGRCQSVLSVALAKESCILLIFRLTFFMKAIISSGKMSENFQGPTVIVNCITCIVLKNFTNLWLILIVVGLSQKPFLFFYS